MKFEDGLWDEGLLFLRGLGDPLGLLDSPLLRESLEEFVSLLLAKNEVVNLTALRDFESAFWKHLIDSLSLVQWEPLGTLVDWGSGGGLPGIPLALARKAAGRSEAVHFLDSVGKKVKAVEEFGTTLGLQGSRYLHCRGEVYLRSSEATGIETVVMRAVAPAERAVHWLDPRVGRWVFMLGPQQLESWRAQEKKVWLKGLRWGRTTSYELPHGQGSRVLLEIVRS